MQYTDNWKYKKWEGEMQNSPYDTKYDLRIYRSLEIYPEDIEIFMTVLMPKIFEIDGKVFLSDDYDAEPGDLIWVQIIHADEHDVWGVRVED